MMYLLWYLVIGLVAGVLCAIDEIIHAKANNLDDEDYVEWLDEPDPAFESMKTVRGWALFGFGLLLWPLRVITWTLERRTRFEAYIAECEEEES